MAKSFQKLRNKMSPRAQRDAQEKMLKMLAAIELHKITGKKMTLGNLLWSIRLCDEKSQSEFAKKLGVSNQYFRNLERGRKTVSPKKAKEFAEKLGYLPEQLVELAVQDMFDHDGIHMRVHVEAAA